QEDLRQDRDRWQAAHEREQAAHAATQRLLLPPPATATERDAPATGEGAPAPETPRNRLVRALRWMRPTRGPPVTPALSSIKDMPDIRTTPAFERWLKRLRDQRGRAAILARLDRLLEGNRGDVRGIGEGVTEMRIDFGPGYRIYYTRLGDSYVMLLAGD